MCWKWRGVIWWSFSTLRSINDVWAGNPYLRYYWYIHAWLFSFLEQSGLESQRSCTWCSHVICQFQFACQEKLKKAKSAKCSKYKWSFWNIKPNWLRTEVFLPLLHKIWLTKFPSLRKLTERLQGQRRALRHVLHIYTYITYIYCIHILHIHIFVNSVKLFIKIVLQHQLKSVASAST